jgi:hypothetical protein
MGRQTLKAREHELFHAVRRWTEENLFDSTLIKDLILSCVRLEALPLDRLLGDVRESRLVSDSAILDAVKRRAERGLVSDSRAYLADFYWTTRDEDTTLEPKSPKVGDFILFKASSSMFALNLHAQRSLPLLRDVQKFRLPYLVRCCRGTRQGSTIEPE